MLAEGLFRSNLEQLKDDSYTKMMGLNLYGQMLLKLDRRGSEATKYLKESEEISRTIPFWWDKIDSVMLPEVLPSE